MVICDELEFCPIELWDDAILQYINAPYVTILVTTTDGGEASPYREVFSPKRQLVNNVRVFSHFASQLVCAECVALKRESTCKHNREFRSEWQTDERIKIIETLTFNRQAFKRETLGVIGQNDDRVYNTAYVDRLFQNPLFSLDYNVAHLFVAIDPNGAGRVRTVANQDSALSNYAVISAYINQSHQWVIAGLENIPTSDIESFEPLVQRHVYTVANRHHLAGSRVITIAENNLAFEADWIQRSIATSYDGKMRSRLHPFTDESKKAGVNTDANNKFQMIQVLRQYLNRNNIVFDKDFYTTSDVDQIKSEFGSQIKNYKQHVTLPSTPYGRHKVQFSGKGDHGMKDDLVMALMILVYWGELIRIDNRFASDRAQLKLPVG